MAKFVLKKTWRFEAPVVVREPGTGHVFDFVGVFELQPVGADGNVDVLAGFKGWRRIADETAPDGELPVTDENRERLLGWEHVRAAIVMAYLAEARKQPEKNSNPPGASGRPAVMN